MTFYDYLMTRADEDTPIGDLARDIRADPNAARACPNRGDTFPRLRHYLKDKAPAHVVELLDQANSDYLEARVKGQA